MHRYFLASLMTLTALLSSTVSFPQIQRPKNTYRAPTTDTAPKYAPQVHPDRTVTLSLLAANAAKVEVQLYEGAAPRMPMTKGGEGVWRVTVGPLEPEIYAYNFIVDGVVTLDMSNPNIDPGRSGHRSYFNVPGTPVRFDERQNVPHGALHAREYVSDVLKMRRRLLVE